MHAFTFILDDQSAYLVLYRPEGLGINRGMHNALDAVWAAHRWCGARGDATLQREVAEERQWLYEKQTLQMHGKNRGMLLGYNRDNSRGSAPLPAKAYTPAPASRYNQPNFPV